MSYQDTIEKNSRQDKLVDLELPSLEELLKREPNVAIPELYYKVKLLLEQNTLLKARVIELEKEVKQLKLRLNTNSHNISKPPSSDGLKEED